MTTTVATPVAASPKVSSTRRRRVKGRRNYLGGFFSWVWLAIIIIPVYYVVITTFKDQGAYFTQNPLGLPNPPTLTAYQQVVEAGIIRYFFNSVIVTVGAVIPLVLFSFLASYAIVRGESRLLRFSRTLFLLGLAIPLQATIFPTKGSNDWTCVPDDPSTRGDDPMCLDPNAMEWLHAYMAKAPPPDKDAE